MVGRFWPVFFFADHRCGFIPPMVVAGMHLLAVGLSGVLPPLSVGEMTLRLYAALNYSQNSALDLRRALNGA